MQILIELDAETLRRLERVAPARSRKRSAFIRAAIQKSLWELEEEKTRAAYLADPDREPAAFDPATWESVPYGGFEPPAAPSQPRTAISAAAPSRPKASPSRRGRK